MCNVGLIVERLWMEEDGAIIIIKGTVAKECEVANVQGFKEWKRS